MEGLPFRVLAPEELDIREGPEETGTSFIQNAILKALYYAERSGLLTVADDSGLCVDALDGRPGLYSSRFGGEGATDDERNRLLLRELEGVPPKERGAHFISAVAAARGSSVLFRAQETVGGRIAEERRGQNGFGYDPLFLYPPLGQTFGELPRVEKDRVSHRGKAFHRLREFLVELGGSP
jgi:XTP/dITP diphosphohydrolase